jgi:hypothetical protein
MQLEGLHMKFPDINMYIAKFKELARQAGYTMGNPKTVHTFIKGLMQSVMEEVFKPPHVTMYQEIKQKVIDCTQSRVLLDNILYYDHRIQEDEGSKAMHSEGSSKGMASTSPSLTGQVGHVTIDNKAHQDSTIHQMHLDG